MKVTKKRISGKDDLITDIVERRYPEFIELCEGILDEFQDIDEDNPRKLRLAVRDAILSPSGTAVELSADQRTILMEAVDLQEKLYKKREYELKFMKNEDYFAKSSLEDAEKDRFQFFNEDRAIADFPYWSKMPTWSVAETVSLCLGKAPEIVNASSLSKLDKQSPFVYKYHQLCTIVQRAVDAGLLGDRPVNENPIEPQLFVEWAKTAEIEVASELESELRARRKVTQGHENRLTQLMNEKEDLARAVEHLKGQLAEKVLSQTERKTFLAIIKVMSESYRYNPATAKSDVTARIKSEMDLKRLPGSDNTTILNKLREAHDFVPKEKSKRSSDN
ncbi:hypothetical protein [Mesorhizobium sp. LNJC394B00]|uniref:hypothetical protein n=1 Tax=unclassified Mesorhizobium TaxID=325217 RepID=UPI0003CF5F71|nr:hypothetical protein [Mesorhizobium sp. LNJC394B00]ESY24309.1 hypothetical protein X750_09315 [Mesorhizobium sp. LNJC394B00]